MSVKYDMKTSLASSLIAITIACAILCFGPNLVAQPSGSGALLTQAYATLSMADHDYKGHRIAAMKQIEKAGTLIGVNVRGDGKGHEQQGVSDQQLRTAQNLLEQARSGLAPKPLNHVNKAIEQISIALSIK
jgi:hypothetical protein